MKGMDYMDSAIRKIQKALKLANGNSNADEAQAAILLAQRLMAKHGLTAQDVGAEEEAAPEARKSSIRKSRVEWWHRKLNSIIADNFRCFGFFTSGRNIGFLGLPEDVDIAIEVYGFAESAIKYHASEYLKYNSYSSSRRVSNGIKNDYISGFLEGLREKFKEQVALECFSLVLVKHEVVIKAHDNAGWTAAKTIQVNSMGDNEARTQGYRDGRDFNNPVGKMIV
ncbi:DUF2786 domain-containing protein [Paenibacillus sp. sgz500992]|uniref:DUF2786 domain-containing protein n=1 Tax=Paenibacillus sp. sgz500992 TaxID=3242476 RepID=UPI0036D3DE96